MIIHAPKHWVTVADIDEAVCYIDSLRPHMSKLVINVPGLTFCCSVHYFPSEQRIAIDVHCVCNSVVALSSSGFCSATSKIEMWL